jgi:hypothetical protein
LTLDVLHELLPSLLHSHHLQLHRFQLCLYNQMPLTSLQHIIMSASKLDWPSFRAFVMNGLSMKHLLSAQQVA